MKMLLVDDQQHVKIVELSPMDEFKPADYFVPCGGCGVAVLHEHTIQCICHKCFGNTRDCIIDMGWAWDHPGVFRKNFGNRITVLAGTGEYRFDFTICNDDHDLGWGPDWSIDVQDWSKGTVELKERGCFSAEEMMELDSVYEYLYADMMGDKTHNRGNWEAEYGSLHEPDGMIVWNNLTDVARIHLTQQMLFGVDCKNMTDRQTEKFIELCAIMMIWLGSEIK